MKKTTVKRSETNALRPFVHLHTHTEYSLLDGIGKISQLVDKSIADGMPGMAITDHANMFGVREFVEFVESRNRELGTSFKPIIGCEVYVARRGKDKQDERDDWGGHHLILLAKNATGYRNLVKIVSNSWLEGYYGRPRTDKADLERYHEGLICCSACIGGEVAQHILNGCLNEAEKAAKWYQSIFGEDYYLELQRHKATTERANHETYKLEEKANSQLHKIAKKLGIKLVCANDAHFVNEEDAEVQDTLLCINWGKKADDQNRLIFSKQEWLKTTAEMNELFGDIPEALESTIEIFNKVEHYSINDEPHIPTPTLPEGIDEVEYLARLAFEGAYERYGKPLSAGIKERLKAELRIINSHRYAPLVLMWHEIVSAARNLGAKMGKDRGFAKSSLLLYTLGITQNRLAEFGEAFYDYINHKQGLPALELEFDKEGRERVLKWIVERYGEQSVANIVSRNVFTAKTAAAGGIRAEKLVGVLRKMDIHSCGVAICEGDISRRIPLAWVESAEYKDAVIVTQYGGESLLRIGIPVLYFLTANILHDDGEEDSE
ncbi:MAG: PHP domain-containing protein [Alistipes sp.]|nr:PHP domain-containing protein [Alistipes sp.]